MLKIVSYIRTHTFFKLILTFIAILTASLSLLGVFSYYSYRFSLIQNAIDSGQTNVNFMMEQLDDEIENLHYTALSVLTNSTLNDFESFSKDPMPDSLFELQKMMKEISNLENSYPSLESVWLYSRQSDLFITRHNSLDREVFLEKWLSMEIISGQPLQEALDVSGPFRYICTSDIRSYYDNARCLTFVRPVTDYQNEVSGQIVINVSSSAFTSVLDKAASYKELTVLLLDERGELICASQNAGDLAQQSAQALEQLTQASEVLPGLSTLPQKITLNGVEYTGWITCSGESGLQYVALIDQGQLLKSVSYIRLLTIGLSLLCLAVSAVLAFSLTARMFEPIRKIVRYIQAEQGGSDGGNYRDVFLIEKFISYMRSQNQQLQKRVDSYTALMQETMLTELLYSQEQQAVMELYQKADLSVSFPYDCFTVAIIPLEQPKRAEDLPAGELIQQVETLSHQEPFSDSVRLWPLSQQGRIVLILNTSAAPDQEIIQLFFDRMKNLYQETGSELLYAYGKTYPFISGIYDSFHQAINILMVKPSVQSSEKAAYEEAINASYITSYYSQETELKLIRQLKSHDFEDGPKALLLEIIQKNKEGAAPFLQLESLFVQLMMTINRIIAEMALDGAEIFGKGVNPYRSLDRFPTPAEKEQYILEAFEKLTRCIRTAKTSKSAEIYQSMLDYVAEHYTQDLSLNDISYHLSLSPSYLSSIFKEYHHGTFLDYVNKYRVAKAKPLLLSTADSVSAIAQKVGYTNVNTFIRIFKKEEGVTPGQYRSGA